MVFDVVSGVSNATDISDPSGTGNFLVELQIQQTVPIPEALPSANQNHSNSTCTVGIYTYLYACVCVRS